MIPHLDLLSYADTLRTKSVKGIVYLWDAVRKKYVVMQPEEMVRQLIITYLINEKKYPRGRMQVERGITVHDTKRRYDLLVRDRHLEPYLLVECKSYAVNLDQSVFDQASLYNAHLKAPYLLITNGKKTYCAHVDYASRTYEIIDIPEYELGEN